MSYNRIASVPEFDPVRTFITDTGKLIDMARESGHDESYSYRGFKVGVAGLFWTIGKTETGLLPAGNLKSKDYKPKFCAEQRLVARGINAGFTHLVGLVVAATTDKGEIAAVTDVPTPTLHPCSECRQELKHHSLVSDETIVITTGFDRDRYQVHTFGQLRRLYDEFEEEALMHDRIADSQPDWDVCAAKYDILTKEYRGATTPREELAQIALLGVEIY